MGYCSAINCDNNRKKGFRMFRFPRDPVRRKTWLQNCKRANWTPSPSSELCELHFEQDQFENHRLDGLRKLKPNAIPTIFNISESPNISFDERRYSIHKAKNQDNFINSLEYISSDVDNGVNTTSFKKFSLNNNENKANASENFIKNENLVHSSENIVVIERDSVSSPTQFAGILCQNVEDLCVVEDDYSPYEICSDELESLNPVLREKIEYIMSENELLRKEVSHLHSQVSQLILGVNEKNEVITCAKNNNVKLKQKI